MKEPDITQDLKVGEKIYRTMREKADCYAAAVWPAVARVDEAATAEPLCLPPLDPARPKHESSQLVTTEEVRRIVMQLSYGRSR